MSTTELAARMGITQSRIPALERGEVDGSIKLDTLRRVAEALDCNLVYALVPRTTLDAAVQAQARRKAAAHLGVVSHHMLLEDQTVDRPDADAQLDELARRFADRRGLWAESRASR
jgi:predicted DNA-binding mobile mystery protein A